MNKKRRQGGAKGTITKALLGVHTPTHSYTIVEKMINKKGKKRRQKMLKILRTNIWCDNGLFEACPIMSGIRSISKRLQICLPYL